jgi:ribosomal protein S18 acetylase RimI-like enzyme
LGDRQISIRDLTSEHLDEVARIHSAALPEDIASLLGSRFLCRALYPTMFDSADACIGAFAGDELVGFIIFSSDGSLYTNVIKRHFMLMAGTTLVKMVSVPFLMNAFSVARYMISAGSTPGGSELAYIAVSPDHQRRGVGSLLVREGLDRLRSMGIRKLWLKTLESTPENVMFYEALGFRTVETKQNRVILVRELVQ